MAIVLGSIMWPHNVLIQLLMGTTSLDGTKLTDQPCIWHHTLGGTPKTGANGLGSPEIYRDHPHMINSHANLTRNPDTD